MKYREMFPNCFSGQGAISAYSQNANCPWYQAFGEDTPTLVETMFAVRSSEKVLTSVIAQFDSDNPAFRFVWLGVFSQFQQKWKRLFDDYATEYSPIDGYVVNETGTRQENNTGKDTTKYGKVVDVSGSDSGTVKDDTTSNDSNLNSGYGFNSVDGVPTDKSAGNSTDNTTTTRNLQSTGKNTQSGQDETDKSEDRNENYTIKKTGNIGYSMPQELLQADLDLWATTYFSRIFEDIENAIFITVYDCEPIRIISKQNGYILPVMTESVLGGGKAIPKADDMNYKVGVDADGNLWYKQGQSKTKVVKFVRSTVDNSITSDTTNDEIFEYLNSGYIVSAVLTYVPGTDFYMTPEATANNAISFSSYTINGISYSVTWNIADMKWVFATHESSTYTLPVMSSDTLGGGKAAAKTDDMTEEVGADTDGKLWCKAGGSVSSNSYDLGTLEEVSDRFDKYYAYGNYRTNLQYISSNYKLGDTLFCTVNDVRREFTKVIMYSLGDSTLIAVGYEDVARRQGYYSDTPVIIYCSTSSCGVIPFSINISSKTEVICALGLPTLIHVVNWSGFPLRLYTPSSYPKYYHSFGSSIQSVNACTWYFYCSVTEKVTLTTSTNIYKITITKEN